MDKDASSGLFGLASTEAHACNCVGPQNGQPWCPCRMRNVIVRDGRYIVPEQDIGPVVPEIDPESGRKFWGRDHG